MSSPHGERAIGEALRYGNALLKVLSRNDVGATKSHQAGYLLPPAAWELFSPFGPEPGRLDKHQARVTWQDGRVTNSVITWYSSKTEYRLTGEMSGDFPWRTDDELGSLFVFIRKDDHEYSGYVLDLDEDVQDIQTALRVELPAGRIWAAYKGGREEPEEDPDECVSRRFRKFAEKLTDFPPGVAFSAETLTSLRACLANFGTMTPDARLIRCIDAEYELFRLVERQICGPDILRLFKDIDDFLNTANTILNRRKSRAGRSLENHVESLLTDAGIPFEMRSDIQGVPDIIIPGRAEYNNQSYPLDRLFVVGVKTTCKDRWRQVLDEAPRIKRKHLLTLQKTISHKQLVEMDRASVSLVVPKSLHKDYPKNRPGELLAVEGFIDTVKTALAG